MTFVEKKKHFVYDWLLIGTSRSSYKIGVKLMKFKSIMPSASADCYHIRTFILIILFTVNLVTPFALKFSEKISLCSVLSSDFLATTTNVHPDLNSFANSAVSVAHLQLFYLAIQPNRFHVKFLSFWFPSPISLFLILYHEHFFQFS